MSGPHDDGQAPDALAARSALLESLRRGSATRVMEVHSGLTALLVEQANSNVGTATDRFGALWLSSLTDSANRGSIDDEYVDRTARLGVIHEIVSASALPLLVDGETGGPAEHAAKFARALQRVGVAGICLEDKTGHKQNSFRQQAKHQMALPEEMSQKIVSIRRTTATGAFTVIARIESFISGESMEQALERAWCYSAAGADVVLIHSRRKDGTDVLEFAERLRARGFATALGCIPTSYPSRSFVELTTASFNLVIYANHMMRAAIPAMLDCATRILREGSSEALEATIAPVNELVTLKFGSK